MDNGEKYAYLMIKYDMPDIIKGIQQDIREDELFTDPDNPDSYGMVGDTHLTLVACMPNDVGLDMIKSMVRPIYDYPILLMNVSTFENDRYDVLKCDAVSDVIMDTNRKICDVIPTFSEYKEYNPHVTIAYLKKGAGKRHLKEVLLPLVVMKPSYFMLSSYDEDGRQRQ